MSEPAKAVITTTTDDGAIRVADLLGGRATFGKPFRTTLEAHLTIESGFPSASLMVFLRHFPRLGRAEIIDKVAGVGLRTYQRRRAAGAAGATERLTRDQSGRLYRTAEIVAKAVDVLGSNEAAERFLEEPAMALDRQKPIDLLSTPAGAELVERHLGRIDHGVYT